MSLKKGKLSLEFDGKNNFNSTTNLKDNEVKMTTSNESVNDYNPFEHRDLSHPNSDFGTLAHLLKCSLGTGILAMPNAFKNGGLVFSIVGTVIIGIICTHCAYILAKSSQRLCRKKLVPSLGFSETAQAAIETGPKNMRKFGPAAKVFVDIALLVTYFLTTSVYAVFVSGSIKQLIDHHYPDLDWTVYIYMLLILVPLILTCQVRELKYLVPFSTMANVFLIVSFVITWYYIFNGSLSFENKTLVGTVGNIPAFLSTVVFAMEGIGVIMPLENSMKKPQHFLGCPGVLNIGMMAVAALYAFMGFFGYVKYGEETESSITYNLPTHEALAQTVKALVATAVFFTFALQYYVAFDILWKYLSPHITTKHHNWLQIVLRILTVCLAVGIAAAVPDLETIISLVGAVCFSILGICIPAAIELVVDLDDGFGSFKWKLWKNLFIMIFATVVLVVGTWKSIEDIIDS